MNDPYSHTIPTTRLGSLRYAWKITQAAHAQRNWQSRLIKGIGASLSATFQSGTFISWLNFLEQPENQKFLEANPYLRFRTLRGYLSTHWNNTQRLKVLMDSFRFAHLKNGPLLQALVLNRGAEITLAEIPLGDDSGNIRFSICTDYRFRREGEWTVRVHCDKIGGELCSVAFSVEELDGSWVAYLGAVQGGSGANEETIKASWKACHGVRAKAMGIFAAQEVISALGITRLFATGNSIQMSTGKHMISVPWNKISFNYDKMWEEADGKPVADGWFELPTREVRRTREEIKGNKRPLYARRYALFDQLSAAVAESLGRE